MNPLDLFNQVKEMIEKKDFDAAKKFVEDNKDKLGEYLEQEVLHIFKMTEAWCKALARCWINPIVHSDEEHLREVHVAHACTTVTPFTKHSSFHTDTLLHKCVKHTILERVNYQSLA